MTISLPVFNPNIITIGNFSIKYYSLAYILGIIFAWLLIKKFSKYQNVIDLENKNIRALYSGKILVNLAFSRYYLSR